MRSTYAVDPEPSAITVRSRPAFAGFGITVDDLAGVVELSGPADGGPLRGRGALTARVQVVVGPELAGIAAGTVAWTDGERSLQLDLRIMPGSDRAASADATDGPTIEVDLRAGDRGARVRGAARLLPLRGGDGVELSGRLLLDPAALGLVTPAFLNHVLPVAWSLTLVSVPA